MKCPVCGYNDDPKAKIAAVIMNNYVNTDTKTISCINSNEDTITIPAIDTKPAVNLVKQSVWIKQQEEAASKPAEQPPITMAPTNTKK